MKYAALTLVILTSSAWADSHQSLPSIPTERYRSIFDEYRPMRDETPQDWRQANDAMGQLRGHLGHTQEQAVAPAKAPQDAKTGIETTSGERR